jgi:oligopeptide transport system substrate-binding protein
VRARGRWPGSALVVGLLLTACTGGNGTSEAVPTPSDLPSVIGEGRASPIFEPDADVLTVAVPDPSTLDPMRLQDPGSELVARQLYEGLTKWDPIQEKIRPAAAQSWSASNGGRTFTFNLVEGMTFHDGTPVTSHDFAFAFDRIAERNNASDIAYTLERVDGFLELNQFGRGDHLSGISTPDDSTLVIDLTEPYYDFPAVLTHPGLVPLSAGVVSDIDMFTRLPVGNGPFQMAAAWEPGGPVVMKAFPGFVDTPELDGLVFLPYPDAAASWLQFVQGEIDVAEVPADSIDLAERTFGTDGFQPALHGYYYGFNLKATGLRDRRLREAVSRAINRNKIATTIYKDTMEQPRGIVPAGMPGFRENICIELCNHSPALARKLVSRLPQKSKTVTIEFSTGTEEPHRRVAQAVQSDLEAVGLKVRIRAYRFAKFLRHLRDEDHAVFRQGWISEYPAPDEFLSPLFRSSSPDNHTGFDSAKVDRLLAEARAEPSDGRRVQLYIEAEKAILRDIPMVPIGTFVTHWAAQPQVDGIAFDATGGFDAVGVSLAQE